MTDDRAAPQPRRPSTPTPSGRSGKCSPASKAGAPTSSRQRPRGRRRAGAAERARRLRAARRGREHLGRADRPITAVDARATWAVLRSRRTTRPIGIRSSTRCRSRVDTCDGHDAASIASPAILVRVSAAPRRRPARARRTGCRSGAATRRFSRRTSRSRTSRSTSSARRTLLLDARRRGRRRRRRRTTKTRSRTSATRSSSATQLVELPTGDFAFTMVRSSSSAPGSRCCWRKRLSESADAELAGIAAKALKEARYHVRHAAEWVLHARRRHRGESRRAHARRARRALALHRRALRHRRRRRAAVAPRPRPALVRRCATRWRAAVQRRPRAKPASTLPAERAVAAARRQRGSAHRAPRATCSRRCRLCSARIRGRRGERAPAGFALARGRWRGARRR